MEMLVSPAEVIDFQSHSLTPADQPDCFHLDLPEAYPDDSSSRTTISDLPCPGSIPTSNMYFSSYGTHDGCLFEDWFIPSTQLQVSHSEDSSPTFPRQGQMYLTFYSFVSKYHPYHITEDYSPLETGHHESLYLYEDIDIEESPDITIQDTPPQDTL